MGCCGSGNSNAVVSGGSQMAMAAASLNGSSLPGQAGFEILEYIGASTGDMSWFGPVTKTRYVFGGNRRVGYVDIKDAPGMVAMADGGRRVFRVYVKAPTPQAVLEMAGMEQSPTLGTVTGEASTATRARAATPTTAESPGALRPFDKTQGRLAQDATLPEETPKTVTKPKPKRNVKRK